MKQFIQQKIIKHGFDLNEKKTRLKIYMKFYSEINKRNVPLNVRFFGLQNILEDV